jgi:hypothetical protein
MGKKDDYESRFEIVKEHAKKFLEILEIGNVDNMGTSVYWEIVMERWKALKSVMGEKK